MTQRYEYRVKWRRAGDLSPRVKRYGTLRGAERLMKLLGPEPWTAFRSKGGPEDLWCCLGHECACSGETNAEHNDAMRADMPALEYARIERRTIGEWEPEAVQ
jgi:hypothetical protein